ncbi:MAG: hypothetical protein RR962_03330 [Hafnia sp.]
MKERAQPANQEALMVSDGISQQCSITCEELRMGRSTKVIIKGREFASKKAAVGYFMNRRDEVK